MEVVTFLGTHYRIGIKGITPNLLTSIFVGLSAPQIGQTVNVAIAPEALMLLPSE
ncbi:MAG: putative spermidine/putrescine transport system ATP-binding protein [Pseudomonadales bacterium]